MSTFAVCFNRFYDMPYIRIKAYPKDQATKEKVVEAINKVFVDNDCGRREYCSDPIK